MKYEVKGTYNMEVLGWTELKEMTNAVIEVLADKEEEYDEAIEALFADRITTVEEIDAVAKKFDIPYDYVEFEGWAYVED